MTTIQSSFSAHRVLSLFLVKVSDDTSGIWILPGFTYSQAVVSTIVG